VTPERNTDMIQLTEYRGDDRAGGLVLVDPRDVTCVREYVYHSFRSNIGEVILKCGTSIKVWETVQQIESRMRQSDS